MISKENKILRDMFLDFTKDIYPLIIKNPNLRQTLDFIDDWIKRKFDEEDLEKNGQD